MNAMNINHLKKYESEDAPPHAGNMIEGYRSIGYNLETAVADIIDNSFAANAKNVWIDFEWDGDNTTFTITDDGRGMSLPELVVAMTPASKNPLTYRDTEDLGRFGLGLKTASFSQCRILTVATKQLKQKTNLRAWNMDYVHEHGWKLLNYLDDKKLINKLESLSSGTTVVWQDIDNLVKNTEKTNSKHLEAFLGQIKQMEMHLAMVFHFFIQNRKLNIWIKGDRIIAWDPFIKNNQGTQQSSEQKLRNGVIVQSYVLPHTSELTKEDFDKGSWIKGWNAHQGFYIYRNNRMIIDGEWLGLYKQEEHSKLSRIKVNIPNTTESDSEWKLDIKKSTIQIPHDIRQELKRIADESRRYAIDIYRKIGKKKRNKSEKEDVPVWMPHKRKGKKCYQINKEHPLIKSFITDQDKNKSRLNRLFHLLEETLPLAMIIMNGNEYQDMQQRPFEGKSLSDLVTMIAELYQSFLGSGFSHEEALGEILRTEPFNHYPELAENIQDEH